MKRHGIDGDDVDIAGKVAGVVAWHLNMMQRIADDLHTTKLLMADLAAKMEASTRKRRLMSLTDAAKELGLSRRTLERKIGDGHIPVMAPGRPMKVDVDDLIERQKRGEL